ncbi:hypothetical protein MRX96_002453 [Rhipicephalus microplus]
MKATSESSLHFERHRRRRFTLLHEGKKNPFLEIRDSGEHQPTFSGSDVHDSDCGVLAPEFSFQEEPRYANCMCVYVSGVGEYIYVSLFAKIRHSAPFACEISGHATAAAAVYCSMYTWHLQSYPYLAMPVERKKSDTTGGTGLIVAPSASSTCLQ